MKWVGLWFWAPVRTNENWAQTLVRVIGNLFRIAVTLIVLLISVIAIGSYLSSRQQVFDTQQAGRIFIEVDAKNGGDQGNGCAPEFPIAVVVRNSTTQTLMRMDIAVSAREPGTSNSVLDYSESQIHWNYIVPPEYVLGMCYRIGGGHLSPTLVYSAEPVSYTVELRPTEEWMVSETKAVHSRWRLAPPSH